VAIYIESLNIESFRGIHALSVKGLNHINIIVGDNNSGKTSVLEAILLLRNPKDFTNILRVARLRDTYRSFYRSSVYKNCINLFPQDTPQLNISINADCNGETVGLRLSGIQVKILIEPEELYRRLPSPIKKRRIENFDPDSAETVGFKGELEYAVGREHNSGSVEIHPYSETTGRVINGNNYLNMVYLSPSDHVVSSVADRILRDDDYKDDCVRILRIFDPEILDILILRDESNRPAEYIKHSTLGTMSLSTYGDGIKKVLSLANGIARAAGGVLLIDEVETAIHSKYYNDIFRFIVTACKQFEVQAFITTHSIEAIDGLLATQDDSLQSGSDDISVLTFRKDAAERRTYSRVLPGRHVRSNREQFDFEVRL
jgi:ABC-type branched-subunit amino acid transport system ATPase component